MKFNMPVSRSVHLRIGLVILSFFVGFVISTPTVPRPYLSKPTVKAAYTRTPPIPKSSLIIPPEITAQAVFIVDLNSQIVLLAKQPNLRLRPASLTKIMTAIVSMDQYEPGALLRVQNGSLSVGAKAELIKGDILTAQSALYALLVPSGNDAAVTLAENFPGGYKSFIDHMNAKVFQLGLTNTHFANVSGVESLNHFTSAYDISIIAQHALARPMFKNIVSTRKITLKSEKGNSYPLVTTNLLLGKPGILGVKTGWTNDAGECLVTYADRYTHPVLISLLGSKDRFGETEKLLDWIYTNYIWE
ncbi:MAG: d-alanyl-D-alanine carboxypeptidase [Candidatus Collierbacteria bacterium GW2011_GWA1_44_12]|uniref:D-alanyl-D-alanine carboxypeptidase n=4 Tax=Candidatus Collieribacteriota TaxID=1752725 RepID=A0A0G1ITX5_9BACT|nr:MAG: d-alanyl-D-alanine carboxypeptidase [Candidatus Collierbacteria bacterium GW2011_GWA1_44_12]